VVVDGQSRGSTAADQSIAEMVAARSARAAAVNKCEFARQGLAMAADLLGLGLGEPHPVSAIHGAARRLLETMAPAPHDELRGEEADPIGDQSGRPDVGKVELAASMRSAASPGRRQPDPLHHPADTIDTTIERRGKTWKLLDTPAFAVAASCQLRPNTWHPAASRRWNAAMSVFLVIDALDGVTSRISALPAHQEDGPPCVVVVNKWDAHRKRQPHHACDGEGAGCAKLYFPRLGGDAAHLAPAGQRVEGAFFAWPCWRMEQHRPIGSPPRW